MFKYQHWTSPVFFPKSTFFLWSTHCIMDSPSLRVQKFTVHGTIFFPPRSEQPSSVVIYWINLKLLLPTWLCLRCWRFPWWELMLSCSMDGKKSKRKKAPGTGFLRPLQIPLFQSCFWKSVLVSRAVFGLLFCLSVWRAVIGWSRGWCNCSPGWAARGYRFADVRQQVWVTG